MALIKCRECGKDVSTEAAACPNCGAPPLRSSATVAGGKPKKKQSLVGVLFLAIVGAVAIAQCSSNDEKKGETKPVAQECAKDDLQCKGDKAVVAASVYCKDPIERLARHSVRWTDGTFELKFSRFRWADKAAGTLTMIGDKAEFQNGFGAYTAVTYECDLAADGKTVLDVRAREGRLPG
ncbi:zinc ribbon domain-containing protein [Ralstonia thomasii]|jgi:hypothetical protein